MTDTVSPNSTMQSFRSPIDWAPKRIDVLNGGVQMLPVLALLILQHFQAGLATSIASSIAISDSAGWLSCSSSALNSHVDPQIDWCMRRPLAVVTLIPVLALAPESTASALIVQALIIAAASWVFLFVMRRVLVSSTSVVLGASVTLVIPAFVYGSNFGPEAMCLVLSLMSATFFLAFLRIGNPVCAILAGVFAVMGLQSRPGNALLTASICAVVVVLLWTARRRVWAVATGASILAVWVLPNRLLTTVGFDNAGHSGNFWAVIYSLATPESDHWDAAYSRLAPDAARWGTESAAFAELLRKAAIEEVLANPDSVLGQMVTNVLHLVRHGPLTLAVGLPTGPAIPRPSDLASTIMGLIGLPFWVASVSLLILLPWATFKVWRKGSPPPRGGWRPQFVPLLIVGWATVVGAIGFFAFTGHDEMNRHLIQNVPYLILALLVSIAVVFPGPIEPRNAVHQGSRNSRSSSLALGVLGVVWLLLLGAVVTEGHRPTKILSVVATCSPEAPEPRQYEVIGGANVNSSTATSSPTAWRVGNRPASSLFGLLDSWVGRALAIAPPGRVLALRDVETGEVIASFLSDEVAANLGEVSMCLDRGPTVPGIKELALAQIRSIS